MADFISQRWLLNRREVLRGLGVSLASLMKLGSFTPDQISRLLCKKDQDISQTATVISYSPRKLEEGLREYL